MPDHRPDLARPLKLCVDSGAYVLKLLFGVFKISLDPGVADGFYEWQKTDGKKQPYYVQMKDHRPFGMAGLWERWDKQGEPIESCTILTTDANERMLPIHERMPVIIPPDKFDLWLDPGVHDEKKLSGLLRPCDSKTMAAYPISTKVNNPTNDVAACIEPLGMNMQLKTVKIEKPDDTNFVLGQTHFIKSVEDIHEALVTAVPGIKFGLAFCEASGKCLVRWSGTDPAMTELAKKNAAAIGAGHSFIVFLGDGFFPLNVLNTLKMVPEVCRILCATANPTEVVLAETEQGRGILGVVDGFSPKGVEDEGEIKWRKDFLRQIGYKQ